MAENGEKKRRNFSRKIHSVIYTLGTSSTVTEEKLLLLLFLVEEVLPVSP